LTASGFNKGWVASTITSNSLFKECNTISSS
jgi:hypothetical protein